MKIWMTGEIDSSVSEKYRNVRVSLEKEINEFLSEIEIGINTWMFVSIILKSVDDDFPEIYKYHRSKNRFESRVKVDYESFHTSDVQAARLLIIGGLLKALENIEGDVSVKEIIKTFLENLQ